MDTKQIEALLDQCTTPAEYDKLYAQLEAKRKSDKLEENKLRAAENFKIQHEHEVSMSHHEELKQRVSDVFGRCGEIDNRLFDLVSELLTLAEERVSLDAVAEDAENDLEQSRTLLRLPVSQPIHRIEGLFGGHCPRPNYAQFPSLSTFVWIILQRIHDSMELHNGTADKGEVGRSGLRGNMGTSDEIPKVELF